MKECLYGTCSNNCCGYCKLHGCHMTVKQMKTKKCLGKNCKHFIKDGTHPYWIQHNAMKQKRLARKQALNEYVNSFGIGG